MNATRVWPCSSEVLDREPAAEDVVDGDRAELVVGACAVDDDERRAVAAYVREHARLRVDRGDEDALHALLDEVREVVALA